MDTPTKTGRSPLHLPELLDHIFSFLSDYTITHFVILVCRQWLHVGQHRIVREQVWGNRLSKTEQDLLQANMGRVDRLCYYYHSMYDSPYVLEQLWTALGERSRQHRFLDWEQRRLQQRQQPSTSNGYIKPWLTPEETEDEDTAKLPLKELRLQGYMGLSGLRLVFQVMAHLTSLEVSTVCIVLSMLDVLESCPLLQRLYVDSITTTSRVLPRPWFSPMGINPQNGQRRKRPPLALRSLVLRNVSVPQSCVETLITITPHLRELVLVVKEFFPDDDDDAIATRTADGPRRIRELVRLHHPATLCSFFFSPPHTALSTDTIQGWIQDSPAPHINLDWTIEGPKLTPSIITHLTVQVPNTITTLHILGKCPILHDYLCASPHLLHLMAPKSAITLDAFDIHFRQTQGRPPPSAALRYQQQQQQQQQQQFPRVWACRRLQTLHIAFLPKKATASSSRLIFGYISRVCPRLQDLEIHGPEYLTLHEDEWPNEEEGSDGRLCVRLESGLCLLSRLEDLERLVVGTVHHDRFVLFEDDGHDDDIYNVGEDVDLAVDFDWMVPAGHSVDRKHARHAWIDKEDMKGGGGWAKRLEIEESKEAVRRLNYQQFLVDYGVVIKVQQGGASASEKIDLVESLEDLGLLRDVKQVLEEMDNAAKQQEGDDGSFRCWPHLHRLSIYCPNIFGLQPEAEVGRILKADDLKCGRDSARDP
ncbi:hypothetical protein KI688_000757 [Linnemannia hyalina]|uniref:F-box domain-containing protein n=1 Tax=Linnemannia hyalina TaxID=64524 RepID=A0A9P7Y780_9FUNG|nr:hypothetical protein KI688_000757 [Linnemannia hyalina]